MEETKKSSLIASPLFRPKSMSKISPNLSQWSEMIQSQSKSAMVPSAHRRNNPKQSLKYSDSEIHLYVKCYSLWSLFHFVKPASYKKKL
jgi:hypothetical protein